MRDPVTGRTKRNHAGREEPADGASRPRRLRLDEQGVARSRAPDRRRRHRRSRRYRLYRAPRRARRSSTLDGAAIGANLDDDPRKDESRMSCSTSWCQRRGAMWRSTAFDHGCHLLTEKPLADSREHARAIIEAARRANRRHAVVQNRRYLANVRRIRRFLDSGAIGAPTSIHADFFVAPHFGGFREEMNHILLLDMAIHTFDAARYMVNGEPRSVVLPRMGAEELLVAAGVVGDGDVRHGPRHRLHLSRQLVRRRVSLELGSRVADRRRSEARSIWDGFDDIRAEANDEGAGRSFRQGRANRRSAARSARSRRRPSRRHAGFRRCGRERRRARDRAATDNIKSLAMVLGAIESAETGRRVPIAI